MKKALVVGAGGQVGSDLVPLLLLSGYDVKIFDAQDYASCAAYHNLSQAYGDSNALAQNWTKGDATGEEYLDFLKIHSDADLIFHLAAILSANGEKNPDLCYRVNMNSLLQVLGFLRDSKSQAKLIWPSTIAAFGPIPGVLGGLPKVVGNDVPMHPTTMYGITKVAGELLGTYYYQKYGVDFRSVRFPGLVNATPPGGGSSDYVPEMYFASVEDREALCFVRPDTQIPFMYMADAVRALLEIAQADMSKLSRRVYNIASISPTAQEFAENIAKYVPGFRVKYTPDIRQEFVDSWPKILDDSLAKADWGWSAKYDLDKMTQELLQEIKKIHLKANT